MYKRQVHTLIPPIKNKSAIFGQQLIMDHEDNIKGEEEYLLINAAQISLIEAVKLVREYNLSLIHIYKSEHNSFTHWELILLPSKENLSSIKLIPRWSI